MRPAPSRSLADPLSVLMTLASGEPREAKAMALRIAAEADLDATLETLPDSLLARAFGAAAGGTGNVGPLSPAERLALVLVRAGGFPEQRAAVAAGMPVATFREHLARAERALAEGPNRRAIVLEDHALSRDMVVDHSIACGLEVVCATDCGAVATAAAAAFAPAIAIIDIDLNGAELAGDLAAMQIRETAPDCHVLFVTGYSKAHRIASVMQNAAALIKPFRASDFSEAVRVVL